MSDGKKKKQPGAVAKAAATKRRKEEWLAAYREHGVAAHACTAIGIHSGTLYKWREKDKKFAAAMEEARKANLGELEQTAWSRAVSGYVEPVYYKGKMVGTVRKYPIALLIFMLKKNLPDKYADRVVGPHESPEEVARAMVKFTKEARVATSGDKPDAKVDTS